MNHRMKLFQDGFSRLTMVISSHRGKKRCHPSADRLERDPRSERKRRASLVQTMAVRAMQDPSEIMRDASKLAEVRALYLPASTPGSAGDVTAQDWSDEEVQALATGITCRLRRTSFTHI